MNPLRAHLEMEEALRSDYQEALRRVCGVQLVENGAEADAIISPRLDASPEGKPLLWIPPRAGHLEPAQSEREGPVMPAATWRFQPALQAIHQRHDAGKLGAPGLLRIHRWTERAELRADLDIACWLFAGEPETLYALSREGYVQCHLGFPDGGMALIDHSHPLGMSDPGYESLTLIGAAGAAYADDHRNVNLRFDRSGCAGIPATDGLVGLAAMLREFFDAVREDRAFAVTLAEFQRATRLVARVERSLEKGAVA